MVYKKLLYPLPAALGQQVSALFLVNNPTLAPIQTTNLTDKITYFKKNNQLLVGITGLKPVTLCNVVI